jgi:hypothetical protein
VHCASHVCWSRLNWTLRVSCQLRQYIVHAAVELGVCASQRPLNLPFFWAGFSIWHSVYSWDSSVLVVARIYSGCRGFGFWFPATEICPLLHRVYMSVLGPIQPPVQRVSRFRGVEWPVHETGCKTLPTSDSSNS